MMKLFLICCGVFCTCFVTQQLYGQNGPGAPLPPLCYKIEPKPCKEWTLCFENQACENVGDECGFIRKKRGDNIVFQAGHIEKNEEGSLDFEPDNAEPEVICGAVYQCACVTEEVANAAGLVCDINIGGGKVDWTLRHDKPTQDSCHSDPYGNIFHGPMRVDFDLGIFP